jgi:hypothetical protein
MLLPCPPVELKTEWFAEGRQCPFGGIGFGRLEGGVVNLAR